uniref:Uncharacterized protein n=1 Tax=Chromera velia CCMP2878 TaxID=1169474 RepID=A0A0G4GGL1_9ALVE|eukprot:Cvel_4681.t1-p1 / transcript=Cvel_4681.t1 / gene=Cvel_4681 / organism=Chromera_velia_CCMP2878 / gene_product=hypothetical protein / transcript_product=hypothetical protein / location=Cvel_scaffold207:56522-57187(+) / protein_length=222 / sequence_SO=supercontig / SO=protein_coding / is_pseudo=false
MARFNHKTTYQTSIGQSPHEVLFGTPANHPIKLLNDLWADKEFLLQDYVKVLDEVRKQNSDRKALFEAAATAKMRNKLVKDPAKIRQWKKGDYLWIEKGQRRDRRLSKGLSPCYEGPYIIMDVKYSGVLAVRCPGSQQTMTISRRRAKPFLSANLEESKQMEEKYRHPEEDTMDIDVDDDGDRKQTPSEKDGDEVDALTDIEGGIQSARKRKAPAGEAPQRK